MNQNKSFLSLQTKEMQIRNYSPRTIDTYCKLNMADQAFSIFEESDQFGYVAAWLDAISLIEANGRGSPLLASLSNLKKLARTFGP